MREIILLILIEIMGTYALSRQINALVLPVVKREHCIAVEKIDNLTVNKAAFRKINYFETDKAGRNCVIKAKMDERIDIKPPDDYFSPGQQSIEIYWKTRDWAELILINLPGDWQDYSNLVVDVINPNKRDIVLELKISERFVPEESHPEIDRFSTKYTLEPGVNTLRLKISILSGRADNSLHKIIHMRFLAEEEMFFIDNMSIER